MQRKIKDTLILIFLCEFVIYSSHSIWYSYITIDNLYCFYIYIVLPVVLKILFFIIYDIYPAINVIFSEFFTIVFKFIVYTVERIQGALYWFLLSFISILLILIFVFIFVFMHWTIYPHYDYDYDYIDIDINANYSPTIRQVMNSPFLLGGNWGRLYVSQRSPANRPHFSYSRRVESLINYRLTTECMEHIINVTGIDDEELIRNIARAVICFNRDGMDWDLFMSQKTKCRGLPPKHPSGLGICDSTLWEKRWLKDRPWFISEIKRTELASIINPDYNTYVLYMVVSQIIDPAWAHLKGNKFFETGDYRV